MLKSNLGDDEDDADFDAKQVRQKTIIISSCLNFPIFFVILILIFQALQKAEEEDDEDDDEDEEDDDIDDDEVETVEGELSEDGTRRKRKLEESEDD